MHHFVNFKIGDFFWAVIIGLLLGSACRLIYLNLPIEGAIVSKSNIQSPTTDSIFGGVTLISLSAIENQTAGNAKDSLRAKNQNKILGFNPNPKEAFSPSLARLVASIDSGRPTRIVTSTPVGRLDYQIAWRPVSVLADNFRYTLGDSFEARWGTRTYQGINLGGNDTGNKEFYSLAIVQNSLFVNITHNDGSQTFIRSNSEGGYDSIHRPKDSYHYFCEKDSNSSLCFMRAMGHSHSKVSWEDAEVARVFVDGLDVAEQGGFNPQNGKLEKYVQTIPAGDKYIRSLRPMLMLAVLDKRATNGSSEESLQTRTSEWLAMISNIASVYENQLGIRLLLQELVLTPTSNDFNDIPEPLDQFRAWCNQYRRQSIHGWSSAVKWGNGLSGSSLGVAYLRSIQGSSSVSIVRPNTGWPTVAHEMGHNLGSEHSEGGIMNSFANGDGGRNFFTDVQDGVTAAFAIYNHSRNRLPGEQLMRNPKEIPFAKNDRVETEVGIPVSIAVLENDLTAVRHGESNQLSISEVSRVVPQSAGEVVINGVNITFEPDPTFGGTAFFSYTLKGDVGNNSNGWLHKGDVAVIVGNPTSIDSWTLAPGESISFEGRRSGAVSITRQLSRGTVHASKDEDSLIVVRADRNAIGSEVFQYRQGGATFSVRVIYQKDKSTTVNDVIVWDKSMGAITLNPLSNDYLAGRQSLQHVNVTHGVGSPGNTETGASTMGWSSRVVSFRNMHPQKGRMETETMRSSFKGVSRNFLTGNVTFTPQEDARGVASIRYVVEDASFQRHTNFITFIFPLADIISPALNVVRMQVGDSLELEARTYAESFPPLSGELDVDWEIVQAPFHSDHVITDHDKEEALFTPVSSGHYLISMTARDGDYSTKRMLSVLVEDSLSDSRSPNDSLFGHWPLDVVSGGSFLDASGNNNTIFHRNVDVLAEGIQGRSVRLNGSNEYFRLTPLVDSFKQMDEGSISIWFQTSESGKQMLFSVSDLINGNQFYQIYLEDGEIHIERKENEDISKLLHYSDSRYDDNQWHHLLVTTELSGLTTLYVDSIPVIKGGISFIKGLYSIDEANFGVSRNGNTTTHFFDGMLDELKIFSKALSPPHVKSLLMNDLPDPGSIETEATKWILPKGLYDQSRFGVFYRDSSNQRKDEIGEWEQIQGPEDIDVSQTNWDLSDAGLYAFRFSAEVDDLEISKIIEIEIVDQSAFEFGWARPELTVFNKSEDPVLIDLSKAIRELKNLTIPVQRDWQFLIEEIAENYQTRAGIQDNILEIKTISGAVNTLEMTIGVHGVQGVGFPVIVHFSRDVTSYPNISLTVPETTPPGSLVADLKQILNINEPAIFRIVNGNNLDLLVLDEVSGELRVGAGKFLNYELGSEYLIQTEVVTQGRTGNLFVKIGIKNSNEPFYVRDQIFELDLDESNSEIGVLSYMDPENSAPTFQILDSEYSDLFTVSNPGGRIEITDKSRVLELNEKMLLLEMEAQDDSVNNALPVGFSVAILLPNKIVDGNSPRKVKVPVNALERLNWTGIRFTDTSWEEGKGGVGYERNSGYERWIHIDVELQMYSENPSVYLRIPFEISDPNKVKSLDLRMFYDDGFIAYINGQLIASSNAPSIPAWNSSATRSHPDNLSLTAEDYSIELAAGLLEEGENILAIHGLNSSVTSSDMLVFPELFVTEFDNDILKFPQIAEIETLRQNGHGRANISIQIPGNSDGADLTLYFGRNPVGTDAELWENSFSLETVSQQRIERSVPGLGSNQFWFFKVSSQSEHGIHWSETKKLFVRHDDTLVLVDPLDSLTYQIPESHEDLEDWRNPDFDDSSWKNGFSGIGYESTTGFESLINTSVLDEMRNKNSSILTRFNLYKPQGINVNNLVFQMNYDDGFAAYINGGLISNANVSDPEQLTWNSRSTRTHDDRSAVEFQSFPSPDNQLILDGSKNVLAIHGLNSSPTSSDFLIRPKLTGDISGSTSLVLPNDSDNDGLPDYWELENFGSLAYNAFDDTNADGVSNFEDYWTFLSGGPQTPGPGGDAVEISILFNADNNSLLLSGINTSTDLTSPEDLQFSSDLKTWFQLNPLSFRQLQEGDRAIIAIELDKLHSIDNINASQLFFRFNPTP